MICLVVILSMKAYVSSCDASIVRPNSASTANFVNYIIALFWVAARRFPVRLAAVATPETWPVLIVTVLPVEPDLPGENLSQESEGTTGGRAPYPRRSIEARNTVCTVSRRYWRSGTIAHSDPVARPLADISSADISSKIWEK